MVRLQSLPSVWIKRVLKGHQINQICVFVDDRVQHLIKNVWAYWLSCRCPNVSSKIINHSNPEINTPVLMTCVVSSLNSVVYVVAFTNNTKVSYSWLFLPKTHQIFRSTSYNAIGFTCTEEVNQTYSLSYIMNNINGYFL